MMWWLRWTLVNYTIRLAFWMMPKSRVRDYYLAVVEAASASLVEAVKEAKQKAKA